MPELNNVIYDITVFRVNNLLISSYDEFKNRYQLMILAKKKSEAGDLSRCQVRINFDSNFKVQGVQVEPINSKLVAIGSSFQDKVYLMSKPLRDLKDQIHWTDRKSSLHPYIFKMYLSEQHIHTLDEDIALITG